MENQHFAVKDIAYQHTETGYLLTINTDVPCHLWMRWTTTHPQIHLDPVIKRGLTIHYLPRYCFVVFEDNEQLEDGDTLEHTFYKPDWPICTTRYLYFWGTIAGQPSPSESPIFEKHRTELEWALLILELWNTTITPPPMVIVISEPWTTAFTPPALTRKIYEEWTL